MTGSQPANTPPTREQTELFLRMSRRALIIVLLTILLLGATQLSMALWPDAVLAQWPMRLPWLLPIAMITAVIALRVPLRGRFTPNSPELKTFLRDEFRQANLSRAQRGALITVLIAQVPMGLLLVHLPAVKAVTAMGASTITIGMVTLIALFLFFDRD